MHVVSVSYTKFIKVFITSVKKTKAVKRDRVFHNERILARRININSHTNNSKLNITYTIACINRDIPIYHNIHSSRNLNGLIFALKYKIK